MKYMGYRRLVCAMCINVNICVCNENYMGYRSHNV